MFGKVGANKGRKLSETHKERIGLSKLGVKRPEWVCKQMSLSRKGEKSPRWRGGITSLYYKIRKLYETKEWRDKVFKRDNYACAFCGDHGYKGRGQAVPLHVDHIKPFAVILKENNITTVEDAKKCQILWDTNNGRTLCVPCHRETDTYGNKTRMQLNYSWKIK